MFDPDLVGATVDFLAGLAGGGAALELGIGTGRIALPLSERGVPVHGIDLSPDMVAQLQTKAGAEAISVTLGDFAATTVDGTFRLAYLVYNTIENLTTQDEQVACFCNVAAHLEPGGCFVIEVEVPQLRRLPRATRSGLSWPPRPGWASTSSSRPSVGGVAPLLLRGWAVRDVLHAVSLRLAGRARPDGTHRRPPPARALGRMAPRAVHERQRDARIGLGEAGVTRRHAVVR